MALVEYISMEQQYERTSHVAGNLKGRATEHIAPLCTA